MTVPYLVTANPFFPNCSIKMFTQQLQALLVLKI